MHLRLFQRRQCKGMPMKKNSRLVYSTDAGRIRPTAETSELPAAGDGIVRLKRESKGRGGKGVTLITGLPLSIDELKALAKELKQLCGTGGTIREGIIEIQGEQRERLKPFLESKGYQVKVAGG